MKSYKAMLMCLIFHVGFAAYLQASTARAQWYAGTWDSALYLLGEHPNTVAIRMELLDKDTHIPVSGVRVSLEGEYYEMWISQDIAIAKDVSWWNLFVDPNKREPQPKEFRLDAVSGPDGIVVFSLEWQKEFPWDTKIGDKWTYQVGDQWLLYVDEIEKVQRLEIRHPKYRYVEAPLNFQHVVGLKQYLDPQRVVADKYKLFEQNWHNEISRRNVKMFVLDLGGGFPEYKKQFCTRPEFFSRIRARDYGEVFQVLENLPNMDDGKKCGPYFVYNMGEILLEPIASRVAVEGVGDSILTQDTQGEGTPWYRQYSRQPDVADAGPREGLSQNQATAAPPATVLVDRQQAEAARINTRKSAGGIVVQDLDVIQKGEIDRVMGHPVAIVGVQVVNVDPSLPAYDAGLRSGMIITSVKRERAVKRGGSLPMPEFLVKTPTDAEYFERLVTGFEDGDDITLSVWRQSEGNAIRRGYVGSEEKGKWYQRDISFRYRQVPAKALKNVSDSRTATMTRQQVQPTTEDAKKPLAQPLPSLKEILSDPAKLRSVVEKATAMKNKLAVTAIRALPMPDPDTGQMTTLDAYARKLAADAGAGGSLGEDPVATAYMMLFDSNFLTDQARVIQLPDGKYGTLTEAIGAASADSGGTLDLETLNRAMSATADMRQAQRAGNGELLNKALTRLLFAISEANASRSGSPIAATPVVAPNTVDGNRPTTPMNARGAKSGKTIDLGSGVSMEFVLIPAGSFYMGSPSDEKDRYSDEGPVRRVQITKSFLMGKFEVTQDQFNAVMGRNPSYFSGRDLPVETVEWLDATQFCEKLSARSAGHFRLPTEAEWEYACRGGSETRFHYGDDPNYTQFGEYAWYAGNSEKKTHSVGQKKPNQFGLHDMHGNVGEWYSDYYAKSYQNLTSIDPTGPKSGSSHVFRGGCWGDDVSRCRVAYRGSNLPPVGRYLSGYGFRVVLDLQ